MEKGIGSYISNDIALYYLTLGKDFFTENKHLDEYKERAIMERMKGNKMLTDEDKQEIWETVIYLKMETWTITVLTSNEPLPANFLGNYSLVREWDKVLYRYNTYVVNRHWYKVHNYGDVPKYKEFKEFYNVFKTFLNRKQLVILPKDIAEGRLTPIVEDLYKHRKEMYESKGLHKEFQETELVETIQGYIPYRDKSLYYLDDYLDWFEQQYPSIKTNNHGETIQSPEFGKIFLELSNEVSRGISIYEDWYKETEIKI